MRRFPKLRPCMWDGLVILAVTALAVGCAFMLWGRGSGAEQLTAVISADGVEIERVLLTTETERTVQSNGYTLRVHLAPGEAWVEEADCPTQDCVHTGHISRNGQSIVCLPARVTVQLQGGSDAGVDLVIG